MSRDCSHAYSGLSGHRLEPRVASSRSNGTSMFRADSYVYGVPGKLRGDMLSTPSVSVEPRSSLSACGTSWPIIREQPRKLGVKT